MGNLKIYYDSIQEGAWFKELHPLLKSASLEPFPSRSGPGGVMKALSYDRPDIILTDDDKPILVLERTIEVPSGHNVGQRFARLVAAAQMQVPVVYFGPYAAFKHGGVTKGPRYMNLRLFHALKKMAEIEGTSVVIINWPVDKNYEIIRTPEKDERVKVFLNLFFDYYYKHGLQGITEYLKNSDFEKEQEDERLQFISSQVAKAENYDLPPDSVKSDLSANLKELSRCDISQLLCQETVLYNVGMTYVRSDPYTGMAMLYSYLYCGGLKNRTRNLIIYFPNITKELWQKAASSGSRKDVRLFRLAADGILFADGYLPKGLV